MRKLTYYIASTIDGFIAAPMVPRKVFDTVLMVRATYDQALNAGISTKAAWLS